MSQRHEYRIRQFRVRNWSARRHRHERGRCGFCVVRTHARTKATTEIEIRNHSFVPDPTRLSNAPFSSRFYTRIILLLIIILLHIYMQLWPKRQTYTFAGYIYILYYTCVSIIYIRHIVLQWYLSKLRVCWDMRSFCSFDQWYFFFRRKRHFRRYWSLAHPRLKRFSRWI